MPYVDEESEDPVGKRDFNASIQQDEQANEPGGGLPERLDHVIFAVLGACTRAFVRLMVTYITSRGSIG